MSTVEGDAAAFRLMQQKAGSLDRQRDPRSVNCPQERNGYAYVAEEYPQTRSPTMKPPVDRKAALFAAVAAVFVVSVCLSILVANFNFHPHFGGGQPSSATPK